jgi:mono/diheme cytochrome c family protein
MLHHSRLVLFVSLPLALAVTGCSSSEKPAEPAATTPAVASRAEVKAHMADHFTRVRAVEEAVIRGDLEAAKVPAQWIADHQETTGLPEGSAAQVIAMKDAAKAVAAAADIPSAAKGAAALVGTCGDCHAASKVTAAMPLVMLGEAKPGKETHMAEHQFAVDLMYRGLVAPSDAEWTKGAEALKKSALGAKDLPEAKDAIAAEKKVHAVAEQALKAADRAGKVEAYGEVVGSCASCHGIHGRIWGPGAPEVEKAPEAAPEK